MVYQPIYELGTGEMISVESLARFDITPHRTPDRWFAMAQAVGLGEELELMAIEKALAALDVLPRNVSVALNGSPTIWGAIPCTLKACERKNLSGKHRTLKTWKRGQRQKTF